jgi:hypothetical protein
MQLCCQTTPNPDALLTTLAFKDDLSLPASLPLAELLIVLLFCAIVMPSAVRPLVYSCVDVARRSLEAGQFSRPKLHSHAVQNANNPLAKPRSGSAKLQSAFRVVQQEVERAYRPTRYISLRRCRLRRRRPKDSLPLTATECLDCLIFPSTCCLMRYCLALTCIPSCHWARRQSHFIG